MRRFRRLLVGALVVATGLVLPADVAHASGPPYNAFTLDYTAGGNGGISYVYSTVTQNPAGSLQFNLNDPVYGTGSVGISPPTGGSLAVGSYNTSTSPDASHAGFFLTQGSSGCVPATGTMQIEEITFDDSANVTAFAASYTLKCGIQDPVAGELRFNSTIPYVGGTETNPRLDFGNHALGDFTPMTLTVTSIGSDPLIFGQAVLGGPNASAYAITADTCSGQSIAAGSTCSVTLANQMTAPGAAGATLTLPDNSKLGYRFASLSSTAFVSGIGTFRYTYPTRLLDTRSGLGAPKGALAGGGVIHLQVTGQASLPDSGVSAVVLNLTETGASAASFLTAYPTGSPRPTASNINFTKGQTLANSVTVPVGTGGKVDIYNNSGAVHVIADISGYFVGDDMTLAGGQYHPINPTRVEDTRQTIGALKAHFALFEGLNFGDAVNSHVSAIVINVTATSPTRAGFLTAWDGTGQPPSTSTVNFTAGATVPNLAIVPRSTCYASECGVDMPAIGVYNGQGTGSVQVVIDVLGYFDDGTLPLGTRFHPVSPTRLVDSRIGQGIPSALGAGQTGTVAVPGSIADDLTVSLALNVTAVAPTKATYLTLWPSGNRPTNSTLNPVAHQTVANAAIALLSNTNGFNVFNFTGTTDVVIDVSGTYELYPYDLTPSGLTAAMTAVRSGGVGGVHPVARPMP